MMWLKAITNKRGGANDILHISAYSRNINRCKRFKRVNKSDLIFYILLTTLALGLGIYYYLDPTRQGVSEYVIRLLHMEGV